MLLSIKRLEYIRAWKRIKQFEEENILLNININSINKGGLITYLEGLKSFIPNSHIAKLQDTNSFLNNTLKCKLLIANEQINQIILSHKCALIYIFAKQFKIGDVILGKIVKIQKYGIFIKVHDITALLHISEISNQHIDNIYKMFEIGKKIKVKIIHIDIKQGRLSVSRRNIN